MKKIFVITRFLGLAFCVLLVNSASAKDYYLNSRIGSDTNDGSSMSPWKTVNHLKEIVFQEGDKILFARGCRFSGSFSIKDSGSKERPIIVGAYGLGNKPEFNNPSLSDQTADIIQVYGSFVVIRNLHFKSSGRTYDAAPVLDSGIIQRKNRALASIYQGLFSKYLAITDCEFKNCAIGINLKGQHNLVTRNVFNSGDGREEGAGSPAAILIANSYNEISYNRLDVIPRSNWLLLDKDNSAAALNHLNVHHNN